MTEQEPKKDLLNQFLADFYFGIDLSQNTDSAHHLFNYLLYQYPVEFVTDIDKIDVRRIISRLPLPKHHQKQENIHANFDVLWATLLNEANSFRKQKDHVLPIEEISVSVLQRMIERDLHYVEVGRPDPENRTDRYESYLRSKMFQKGARSSFHVLASSMENTLDDILKESPFPDKIARKHVIVDKKNVNCIEYIRNSFPLLIDKWQYKHPGQSFMPIIQK